MKKSFNEVELLIENHFNNAVLTSLQNKMQRLAKQIAEEAPAWMDFKTAARYLEVSQNTFSVLKVHGLKFTQIDTLKRVSKTELIRFLKAISNSEEDPTNTIVNNASLDFEWMDLISAAKYIGVSKPTFCKYILRGLEVTEIDNVKHVSKADLERFMKKHSK